MQFDSIAACRTRLARLAAAALLAPAACLTAAAQPVQEPPVRALSGGIGSDESEQLRGQQDKFSATFVFARPGGEYIAGVNVRITRADGTMVYENPSAGPWLLIDLPPGSYRVQADHGGQTRTTTVDIAQGRKMRRTLTWNEPS